MANNNNKRKENLLEHIFITKHFVVKYSVKYHYGIFFTIGKRNGKSVQRNIVKRFFREELRKRLKNYKIDVKDISVCLIAKKYVKFREMDIRDIKDELKFIIEKITSRIKRLIYN